MQAYVGELHGVGNWEFCQMLAESHALEISRRYDRDCFPFLAVRRDLIGRQMPLAA